MKMKQTLTAVLLACAALTAACTKVDTGIDKQKGKAQISLQLTLPAQTEVRTRGIDDSRENEVNRLDVFTFDGNGDLLANVGHQTIRSFNQPSGSDGLGNKLEVSIVLDRSAAASQQFYVVANGRDEMFTGITTKAQLEALEFTSPSMPRYLFVMTGSTALVSVASLSSLPMTLTRSVARVDVLLAGSVTNFKIKSARIMQAREGAYAFQKTVGGNVDWPASAMLKDYATVQITSDEEQEHGFTSKLYAYENYNDTPADLGKTTVVILGGEYASSGQTTYYRIDIKDSDDKLQILRNNRYEITVNSVDGPGSVTEEDAVIGTANIRYTIDVWKETAVNAEFDGTTSLKVSENNIRLPRDASGGIIYVETTADAWSYTAPTGIDGKPAGWLTIKKDGDNCNYMATVNSSGAERVAYFYIRAGQKLKIKVKVTQAFGDAMIIKLSSTGITVPSTGTSSVPASMDFTAERENVAWVIEQQIVFLGYNVQADWAGFVNLQQFSGNGDGRVELNVLPLTVPGESRTAVVKISATDVSTGVTEYYKFTVTQNAIEQYVKIDRSYIASTQTGAVHKITVKSNTSWVAEFTRESTNFGGTRYWIYAPAADDSTYPSIAEFVEDQDGTPFDNSDPKKAALRYEGQGDDVIYIKFKDYSGDAGGRVAFTTFTYDGLPATAGVLSGTNMPLRHIRMFQGIYGVVTINGKTILDRNLGAASYFDDRSNPGGIDSDTKLFHLFGCKYQWGRVPDGYETLYWFSKSTPILNYCSSGIIDKMPAYGNSGMIGDPLWIIGNWNSWFKVTANTPEDQREFHKFWDADGKANFNSSNTVTDGTGWTGLIENTNAVGVKTKFDPCPKGWRVPTAIELRDIFEGGSKVLSDFSSTTLDKGRWMVSDGDGGKNVFFPAAGAYCKGALNTALYAPKKTLATDTNGSISGYGAATTYDGEGYYMSSSLAGDETTFWYYFFDNTADKGIRWNRHPSTNASFMAGGMSIRCIKDEVGIY